MSTHRVEAWLFPTWFGWIGSRFVMKSSIYILLLVRASSNSAVNTVGDKEMALV